MVSTILIDWILIRDVLFLVSILVSSKVASFHNEADVFSLPKTLGTYFLILAIGILYKSAIFSWYADSISLLIFILSGAKG